MRYKATFSGGKDSLRVIIWCMQNLQPHEWDIVFCDTDWEDEITYKHIDEIEVITGKRIVRLKHEPFPISETDRQSIRDIFGKDNIFAEMVVYKGRFPSTKGRFCTEKLKAEPMIDYILGCFYDIVILQGVRAEESEARRNIPIKFCTKIAKVRLFVDDLLNTDKHNLYNPQLYNSIMESPLIEKFEYEEGDVFVIKKMKVPTIKDVVKYVSDNPDQTKLFEPITGCISPYNICDIG